MSCLKPAAAEAQIVEVIGRPYLARLVAPAMRDWFVTLLAAAEPVSIAERKWLAEIPRTTSFLSLR